MAFLARVLRGDILILPTILICILIQTHCVGQATADVSSGIVDGNADDERMASKLDDFFKTLLRKRRQLEPRNDETKEGFTDIEKEALLTIHNSFRSAPSPSAANMIELRWDNDIETYAQTWATNCTYEHQKQRNVKTWTNMGESLFYKTGGLYSENQVVTAWWNEYKSYTFSTKACTNVCGHYVTAAWAKSEYIGCGIKRCQGLEPSITTSKSYYVVCDYSGSFLSNARPYEEGTACSNCPAAYPECRYNLCVSESMLTGCTGYNGSLIYTDIVRENSVTDAAMSCPGFAVDPTPTPSNAITTPSNAITTPSNEKTTKSDSSANAILVSFLLLVMCVTTQCLWCML